MHDHCDTLISGRYRLLKRLRRGCMSEVFLAFDEQEQRQVALKIVMNSDAECIKRLQREVRILRTLSHPHILPLLDDGIFEVPGRPQGAPLPCSFYYLVMPYMQGGNLRERLAQGSVSLEEAGVILHQLADALDFAHRHGIIHRDIKPSNILLETGDATHLYLADFGIAKIAEEGSDITQTGFLVGTPEYMAPELAERPESKSSDIYAVGVLLYQMLTGRLPFTGTTPIAVCWKHIKEQPALPSSLNPDLSPAIEQVILRAMHKNPRLRFADAGALWLAYAEAMNGNVMRMDAMEADAINRVPTDAREVGGLLPEEILRFAQNLSLSEAKDDIAVRSVQHDSSERVLPSSLVMVRKVGKGFATGLPAGGWQRRVGAMARRGALSAAALLLLALPVSLGFVVAREGLHTQPSATMSRSVPLSQAFVGGSIASKVVPPQGTVMPAGNGGRTPPSVTDQPKTDLSQPMRIKRDAPANGGGDQGYNPKHKHGDD